MTLHFMVRVEVPDHNAKANEAEAPNHNDLVH